MIMITDNNDDSDIKKNRLKFVVMVSILRYWFERETSLLKKQKLVSVCLLDVLRV